MTGDESIELTLTEILPSQQTALGNLMKMYCCEWAQYNLFDVDENGEYPFEQYLGQYFERPNRHNFFIRADGKLAGFALIDDDFAFSRDSDYSLGEFFVLPKYRRCGAGRFAATTLFDRFPGKWEVGFHPHNVTSAKFWNRTIRDYAPNKLTLHEQCPGLAYHDGTLGSVFTFDNRA